MPKNRSVPITVLLLVIGISFFYFYFQQPTPKDENTITIGTSWSYAPFASLTSEGELEGFDIDLAYEVGQQLHKKIVFKEYASLSELFTALNQKQIDAVVGGLSITSERLKKVAMIPYEVERVTTYPLFFWKKIPEGITSLNDMTGLIVDVEPGSIQEKMLDLYPQVKKKLVPKITDAIFDLQYGSPDIGAGKATAALVEPIMALKLKQKFKDLVALNIEIPAELQGFGMGIAIRHDNAKLYRDLFYAIAELKQNKTLKKLKKKWGLVVLPQ